MMQRRSPQLVPYSCDLHMHSALSPCAEDRMTPPEVVKKIMSLDIDVFSITDHNSVHNCSAFEAYAREKNVLFIPGIELQSSEEIHLLGYFPDIISLNDFYRSVRPQFTKIKNDPRQFGSQLKVDRQGSVIGEEEIMLSIPLDISIDELVNMIHNFQGLAVAAHLDRGFSLVSQLGFIPPYLDIDAVEIWNVDKIDSIKAKFFQDRDINILSSGDYHYLEMMKPPKMKLWLEKLDVKSCLDCIKGVGPGRVTIKRKTALRSRTAPSQNRSQNTNSSSRDWKNLYG